MGGGRRRRNPTAGGPTQGAGAGRRRPVPELLSISPSTGRSHPPASSSRKTNKQQQQRRGPPSHAVPYSYLEASRPPTVVPTLEAFVDVGPSSDPTGEVVPAYEYDSAVVGGLGVGFHGGDDLANEEEEEMPVTPEAVQKKGKNKGFLSIGGVRIYTEDTSSPEEEVMNDSDFNDSDDDDDVDNEDEEEEENESDDDDDSNEEEENENDDDDDDSNEEEDEEEESSSEYDDATDMDEELVADYLEGVGGSEALLSGIRNASLVELESDDEMDEDVDNDGLKKVKLGPLAMMRASEKYGMLNRAKASSSGKGKGKGKRNGVVGGLDLVDIELLTLDDMLLVKDSRASGSRGKKGAYSSVSQLSRSWPTEGWKRKYRNLPGIGLYACLFE